MSQIRAIVLGLIRQGDRIFVAEGYDAIKQEKFYRALGGGIEFGETSLEALQREFREEIAAELSNIQYLGCLENLFTFHGKPGHEIVQLYSCEFAHSQFYQLESLEFTDDNCAGVAAWVELDRFRAGELKLVPPQCLDYLPRKVEASYQREP